MNFDLHTGGPCIKLWLNVLYAAVTDARGGTAISPYERWHARRWLHSAARYPGSFRWICDILEADPDRMLESLKLTKEHVTPYVYTKQTQPEVSGEPSHAPGVARGCQCAVCSHKGYKRCCCRSQRGSVASHPNTCLPVEER